ncbi:ATP-dependent DNA helicase Rep [Alkalihalophilus pseudofirmus]|uniref:ATP-dependent helicase n=1 Tax=Alkalihalophilus pseudofirmus TaxID=79885 RepID=UPI000951494F|nr:ATP-dependent DNA helicase Rep [Alkalihalophilus pseudofirmus]
MKTALYKQKVIQLSSIERSQWQQMYNASIRQELTCMHCGEPLRIYIGIHEAPFFIHPPTSLDCLKEVAAYEQEAQKKQSDRTETASLNGFKMPVRREISSSGNESSATDQWKPPEPIKAIPTFTAHHKSGYEEYTGYRATLKEQGILLDDQQWNAATTTEGPLLILAGAGSGKTRVLTTRAAYMLTEKNYSPKQMILVTFTAKAAKEMKERMTIYPGVTKGALQQLVVGTFHSIFYRMLMHYDFEKWNSQHLLKWDWQKDQMLKEAGREIDLDEKEFAYDQALTQISWWKNHMQNPNEIKPKDIWEERAAYLYKRYEQMRTSKRLFDFDDMLLGCYDLLTTNQALLERYQERFAYVSIDEFQDINKVQVELITLLTETKRNLCVVGDDDQSIYAFRGSDPDYILNFKSDYPEAKVCVLDQNYRSTHPIVESANNVITTNKTRFNKQLHAQHTDENAPVLFFPYDEEEEATMIVNDIKSRIKNGAEPSDFAVLFRTNVTSRALFERMVTSSLPFSIESDGDSFYRRKAVRKVLAYLQLCINPDNGQAIQDLIGALFLKQQVIQDLKALTITEDCSFVEALTHLSGLPNFQQKKLQKLPEQFKQIKKKTPVEAIAFIEQEMGLKDYLKKQGNEGNKLDRGSDDVRDLKVAARQHETIEAFIQHVDHMIAKQEEARKMPAEKTAVQLLTIHRAKGLEYKHVYILGANEGSLPHDYALDAWREGDDKPLEEERRLMYVAMTRAKNTLAISVPTMRRGKRAHPSRFVREVKKMARTQSKHKIPSLIGGKR